MSEVNENVQNETQETANVGNNDTQIEIKEPGKVKKALKWVIGGLVVVATAVTGILLGRGMSKDDDNDSAEAEAPQDE